ncbi:MAG TPA: peptidylprolyl isomerase [Bacteroidia bacterium]|nr:peptidylprolyl isomerase [Bacteroidia bacterium]
MKQFILCSIITLAAIACKAQPQVADKVVAVMGGKIILQSDVQSQYMEYVAQNTANADTKCKVLEDLLYQKLLQLEAEKDSTIIVSDAQVDAELEKRLNYYVSQFGSKDKFEAFYGKTIQQFKDELRGDVKDILLAQQMRSKVTEGITVSPEEVRKYFEAIPADSIPYIQSQVEIAELVKMPAVSDEEKNFAKEKLEGLRSRVLKGESMSNLAILYSMDPGSAKNGGVYKDVRRREFDPEIEKRAFSLNDGEYSEVFETSFGYDFLQVVHRHGDLVDLRHILIRPMVSDDDLAKSKTELDSIYTAITKDSLNFSEAAARFSDDKNTKYSGGVIINPQTGLTRWDMNQLGELDPTISFTINSLKIGDVSPPTFYNTPEAKQAYRIIKLNNITKPHKANLVDDYQQIQAAALAKKESKTVNEWINRKLREGIFVKIDSDYNSCHFQNNWLNP